MNSTLRNILNLPWKSFTKEALDRSTIVAKFFCILHVTNTYICSTTQVIGPSMFPTLNHNGDVCLIDRFSHRFGKVTQGDIVVVRSPDNPRKMITKRVLGLEGDPVTYMVDPGNSEETTTIVVPQGHVWVQGDNIYASRDSRNFGPIPYGLVEGKVFYRIWPLIGLGTVEHGMWK
ncbi:hypothetical protein ACHQM5_004553 [Ranunculus cassubicifolius]